MRRSLMWCFVIVSWWVWFAVFMGMDAMMATPVSLVCTLCMKVIFGSQMEDVVRRPVDGEHTPPTAESTSTVDLEDDLLTQQTENHPGA